MKKLFIFIAALGWVLCLAALSLAQEIESREELIYGVHAFNGQGYEIAFAPETEDTIYLIANKNSTICGRITLVCLWPITGKYIAGFEGLNEDVEGTLEILKGKKVIKTLEKEDTAWYYYSGSALLLRGEKAHRYYEKFTKATGMFEREIIEYYEAQRDYEESFNNFLKEIRKKLEAGEYVPREEAEARVRIFQGLKPPNKPDFEVTSPQKDYIINLSPGNYKIRLRAEDGTIIQDSEKNLVVFTSRRTEGTGYEIIPGNRWTKRESCNDPNWVIYVAGENTLYFRPFIQNEYNELYYNKLEDPQNKGREEKWRWVHTIPIEDVTLHFSQGKRNLEKVTRVPYYVEQFAGQGLGYEIIEFDAEEMPGKFPAFEGYKLVLTPASLEKANYEIKLGKRNGEIFPGGERKINLVKEGNLKLLYIFSISPLVIGLVIFIRERRKLS